MFDYNWNLKDGFKNPNNYKVFSCFAAGGGSSMGYKLAGYDVLGCNEIDPKIIADYKLNLNPKLAYNEDIRTFKIREDLPDELYNLDILDGSPPCFVGDTLVMTDIGYKKIQDINLTDKVLTHKNRFRSVTKLMKKNVNEILELNTQNVDVIETTNEHPFYVRRMNRRNKFNVRNFSEPFWKNAKDLNIIRNNSDMVLEQDYIGVPVNDLDLIPNWDGVLVGNKIKKDIDCNNPDFWYLIGRWFGDGWTRLFENTIPHRERPKYKKEQEKCLNCDKLSRKHVRYDKWTSYCSESCRRSYSLLFRKKNRSSIIICCGKHEVDSLREKIEIYTKKYTLTEERTVYKFHISSKELCYFVKQFGSGAGNKKLTSDILNLPKHLLQYFLNGYLDADGYKYDNEKYACASISKELIYGVQSIIHKLYNVPTSITKRIGKEEHIIENRKVKANDSYSLSFNKNDNHQGFFENGYIWMPFRTSQTIKKDVTVYNLSVEEDESYTVYNTSCHNCSVFSMAGVRERDWGVKRPFSEGGVAQTLDDLFFEWIEVIEKLQPKVIIGENVKGITMGRAKKYVINILKALDKVGYYANFYVLDSSKMGIPQKRERFFVVGVRKDIASNIWDVDNNFSVDYSEFDDISEFEHKKINLYDLPRYIPNIEFGPYTEQITLGEAFLGTMPKTTKQNYKPNRFGDVMCNLSKPLNTILTINRYWLNEDELLSLPTMKNCGSWPQDYKWAKGETPTNVLYNIGMSVPPVMMAWVSTRVKEQILDKIN